MMIVDDFHMNYVDILPLHGSQGAGMMMDD